MAFLQSITAGAITGTSNISFMNWATSGVPMPGGGMRLAGKRSYRNASAVKWSPLRGGADDFFKSDISLASINRDNDGPRIELNYFSNANQWYMTSETNKISFKVACPFGTYDGSAPGPLEWAEHGAVTIDPAIPGPLGQITWGGDDGESSSSYSSAIVGYPAVHGTAAGAIGESYSGTNGVVGALSASWGVSSDGKSITPGNLEFQINRGGYDGSIAGGRTMTRVMRITSSGSTHFSEAGYQPDWAGEPRTLGSTVRIQGYGISVMPPGTSHNYIHYGGFGFAPNSDGIVREAMYAPGTHPVSKGIAWTTNSEFKDGNAPVHEMTLDNGILGLGTTKIGLDYAPLSISGSKTLLAYLRNVGDSASNVGIKIQTGKDTPSVNGDCVWLALYDGDNGGVSYIQYDTGGDGAAFASISDVRLKKNIFDTDVRGLDIVNQMKFRKFDWDKKACKEANWGKRGHESMWLVAQEVEKVLPEAVNCDESGYKVLGSSFLIKYNSKAIQELSNKVDILEIENKKLKKELEEKDKDFEMRITNLETKLTKGF